MTIRMTEQEAVSYLTPHYLTNDAASIGLTAGKMREAMDTLHGVVAAKTARIASLEALALELAKGVIAVRDLMAESGGVYDLHLNGDPSPWEELTEGGRFEGWLIDYSAAESALSHPLVSELTGEKG